ncbi:hypothetical protein [Actomonas aquatica]|uniref:Uncharacterized protein n=1 Tax=Actomonas aquatica TaxID=2866162 RepID=A0ABZ1CAE0_9BACT|nr:hypothetical protein [Opitutus sp. WL0086]WRQ88564.1 hypothetical protein K1X11_004055 [Opitutus sp. WL0086]
MDFVPNAVFAAPFFALFELVQLIVSERYIGVKQIKRGTDPREEGPPNRLAGWWVFFLVVYWMWMGPMLYYPFTRMHMAVLIGVGLFGYALRRNAGLKWILVILTFEGAIRIGILISLIGRAWRALT